MLLSFFPLICAFIAKISFLWTCAPADTQKPDSEIAEKLDCSRRTLHRRMTMIRHQWKGLELDNG